MGFFEQTKSPSTSKALPAGSGERKQQLTGLSIRLSAEGKSTGGPVASCSDAETAKLTLRLRAKNQESRAKSQEPRAIPVGEVWSDELTVSPLLHPVVGETHSSSFLSLPPHIFGGNKNRVRQNKVRALSSSSAYDWNEMA